MAYGIPDLRQQQLFENYGLSMGGGGGFDPTPYALNPDPYAGEQQQLDPRINEQIDASVYQPNVAPPPPPTVKQRTPFDLMEAMNQYQPETAATDRFNQLLEQFPQQERPSLGRTLVSSAMGLGRGQLENSQKFLHEPYIRDVAAWKEQMGPAYNAANLERQANVNERTLTGNLLTAGVNQERYASDAENTRFKNEVEAQKKLGWSFDTKGPTVIATRPDGTVVDTGKSTGNMTEWDKEQIRYKTAMDVQGSRNVGAAAVQDSRNTGNLNVQQSRNAGNLNVQESRNQGNLAVEEADGGDDEGEDSPAAAHRRTANRFEYLWNNFPELRKYVQVSPGGTYSMSMPPGGGIRGTTAKEKADYQRALDIAYPRPAGTTQAAPPGARTTPSVAPSGPTTTVIRGNPTTTVDIAGAKRGLSPSNVTLPTGNKLPTNTPVGPTTPNSQGPAVISYSSESNPSLKKRSLDGGKTWQFSNDAGVTWSK